MDYTRNISIDVNAVSEHTVVRVKQGDHSTRYIHITLTSDGVPVSPPPGTTAVFRLEKPDGKAIFNGAEINSDGTITVEMTSACTTVVGRSKADISLIKDGSGLSTVVFCIDVLPSPDVAGRIISTDEFLMLDTAISDAVNAAERAESVYEKLAIFGFSAETDGHVYVWNVEHLDDIDFVLQPNGHMEVING